MDMQVKVPGNFDGGHGPFFSVDPYRNLVFQLFFSFGVSGPGLMAEFLLRRADIF
ncbi:hypothetical protein SEEM1594_26400 [Salmonella enterica subsp. enterica serovar Muenchen str. baa1594]|nr:hypothetical protein SEEM1594_26400 [Salmonella enterica subsp. enterica serovar Muenchen str. baa1594]